ncbi:hypothetical protein BDV93DRAFT_513197 [Ceratobasidium sp. AG-I]|nr:hypothetical protein BDV93DRAFT_513197 [Ceratobasidium sp. AG-I]
MVHYEHVLARSVTECRVHKSVLLGKSPSLLARVLRRNALYASQIEVAYQFVVRNYQPGDHVMLLGWLWFDKVGVSRYDAIRRLATLLARSRHNYWPISKRSAIG